MFLCWERDNTNSNLLAVLLQFSIRKYMVLYCRVDEQMFYYTPVSLSLGLVSWICVLPLVLLHSELSLSETTRQAGSSYR